MNLLNEKELEESILELLTSEKSYEVLRGVQKTITMGFENLAKKWILKRWKSNPELLYSLERLSTDLKLALINSTSSIELRTHLYFIDSIKESTLEVTENHARECSLWLIERVERLASKYKRGKDFSLFSFSLENSEKRVISLISKYPTNKKFLFHSNELATKLLDFYFCESSTTNMFANYFVVNKEHDLVIRMLARVTSHRGSHLVSDYTEVLSHLEKEIVEAGESRRDYLVENLKRVLCYSEWKSARDFLEKTSLSHDYYTVSWYEAVDRRGNLMLYLMTDRKNGVSLDTTLELVSSKISSTPGKTLIDFLFSDSYYFPVIVWYLNKRLDRFSSQDLWYLVSQATSREDLYTRLYEFLRREGGTKPRLLREVLLQAMKREQTEEIVEILNELELGSAELSEVVSVLSQSNDYTIKYQIVERKEASTI